MDPIGILPNVREIAVKKCRADSCKSRHPSKKFNGSDFLRASIMEGYEAIPRCSMYGIYIYHKFRPNVGKYFIHGAYGI